jgi:hypothetical protein
VSEVFRVFIRSVETHRFIFLKDGTGNKQFEKVLQADFNIDDPVVTEDRAIHFVERHDMFGASYVEQGGGLPLVLGGLEFE